LIRVLSGLVRRRRRVLPPPALAALALAACGSEASDEGTWGAGHGPDFCQAGRQSAADELWITLRLPAAASALSVRGPAFTLAIDGAPVRVEARGARSRDGKPGLDFHFNPRPLLRRHPSGFEVVVAKQGREIYRTRVTGPEASKAIEETLACDRELRFQGRVDPYKA
jgi:hypothetical protein